MSTESSPCDFFLTELKAADPMPTQYPPHNQFFDLEVKQPKEGPGHLLKITFTRGYTRNPLMMLAIQFPAFFKKFDIYAQESTIIIPDAVRLSSLSKNGLQFQDMAAGSGPVYTEAESDQMLEDRRILLNASNPTYFEHDRTVDHTLAHLTLPSLLFEKLRSRLLIERDFTQSQFFLNHPDFKDYYNNNVYSRARYWDEWTAEIGIKVLSFVYATHSQATAKCIFELAQTLRNVANSADNYFDSEIQVYRPLGMSPENKASFTDEAVKVRLDIAKKYPLGEIKDKTSFALEEALRIAHELTGFSIEKLKDDFNAAGYSSDLKSLGIRLIN